MRLMPFLINNVEFRFAVTLYGQASAENVTLPGESEKVTTFENS